MPKSWGLASTPVLNSQAPESIASQLSFPQNLDAVLHQQPHGSQVKSYQLWLGRIKSVKLQSKLGIISRNVKGFACSVS